ncbi:MAG: hypothetical protein LBH86_01965 [Oscillospiraceae bacterium]|jgi:hypothetical protein|nr:hypothetical protein [Oscillospiraceae bacterium]
MSADHDFAAVRYAMTSENGLYRFTFFCALCGRGHTSGLIHANSVEIALHLARQEARGYFNGCHTCGRWVCDGCYNMDVMTCARCAGHYLLQGGLSDGE